MGTDTKQAAALRLRTYAHDLEMTRDKKGLSPKPKPATSAAVPSEPTLKNKPAPAIKTRPQTDKPKSAAPIPKIRTAPKPPADSPTVLKRPAAVLSSAPKQAPIEKGAIPAPKPIQKEALKVATTAPVSKKSNEVRDTEYEATIITDTKHKRFNLLDALVGSIKDWWSNHQKNRAEKKKPKYTVPRADRRKGVIQRATSKTGRAADADHSSVIKRIKEGSTAAKTAPIPAEQPADPETDGSLTISKYVDSDVLVGEPEKAVGYSSQPDTNEREMVSQEPVPVIVPTVPVTLTEEKPAVIEPIMPKPVTPVIPPLPEESTAEELINGLDELPEKAEEDSNFDSYPTEAEPVIDVSTPTPTERPPILPNIPIIDPASTNPPADTREEAEDPNPAAPSLETSRSREGHPSPQVSRLLDKISDTPHYLVFSALTIITLAFGGYLLFNSLNSTPLVSNNETDQRSIYFNGATRYQEVLIATNKQTLFDQVRAKQDETTSLMEVVFVGSEANLPIPASTYFDLLEVTAPADFKANVNAIIFGYYRGEPWLLLFGGDYDTLRGGMQQWESDLSQNLEPWFGSAIRISTTAGNGFKDGVIGTTDVRVLQNSAGQERITYGFLDPQTLLITTNTNVFLNLRSAAGTN